MKITKLLAAAGVVAAALVPAALVSTASSSAQPARPLAAAGEGQLKWSAAVIPSDNFAVGNSLPYGTDGTSSGEDLTANGISSWLTTCHSCTYDFVFFVFSNEAQTANVSFHMTSPSGASVYQYTWASEHLSRGSTWFFVYAKGDYAATGTYSAYVDGAIAGKSTLLGWAPLYMSPPKASGGTTPSFKA